MGSIVLSFRGVQELVLVSSLSDSEGGVLFSLLAIDTYGTVLCCYSLGILLYIRIFIAD